MPLELDGQVMDSDLAKLAHKLDKSGRISKAHAKQLLDKMTELNGEETHSEELLKGVIRSVLQNMKCTAPARKILEAEVGAVAYKPHTGYYVHIDGNNYDRSLLALADKFAKDGHISVADSKAVWEDALDGGKVTAIEVATLHRIMKEYHCTKPAKAFLTASIASLDSKGHPRVEAAAAAAAGGDRAAQTPAVRPSSGAAAKSSHCKSPHTQHFHDHMFEPSNKLLSSKKSPFRNVVDALNQDEDVSPELLSAALCRTVVTAGAAATAAERDESIQALKALLAHKDVSPNPTSSQTAGALYLAAKLNVVEAAEVLLQMDASVVAKYESETPLQVAMRMGSNEVLALMLRRIGTLENAGRGRNTLQDKFEDASDASQGKRKRGKSPQKRKRTKR